MAYESKYTYSCPCGYVLKGKSYYDKFSRDCPDCGNVMQCVFEILGSDTAEPSGEKFDDQKHKWSLVPWRELATVVDVLQMGAQKYSIDNWKGVRPTSRYIDAAFRHLTAYAAGDKLDNESGKSHLAHTVCCMLFLMYFDNEGV